MTFEPSPLALNPAKQLWPTVVEAMRELDMDLSGRRPRKLTVEMQLHADWAVTMGCGDACPYVANQSEDWDIPDPADETLEVVREIRDASSSGCWSRLQASRDIRADLTSHQLRLARCYPTSPRSSRGSDLTPRSARPRTRSSRITRKRRCVVRDDNRPPSHARVAGGGPVRRATGLVN